MTPPAGTQFARVVAQGGAGGGGGGGFGLTGASTPPGLGMNIVGYLPISSAAPLEVAGLVGGSPVQRRGPSSLVQPRRALARSGYSAV